MEGLGNNGINSLDGTHGPDIDERIQRTLRAFEDPIKLNVGGTIFMTSRATLMKEESLLRAMFSGRYAVKKGDDGAYFIDRDPKHFGKILNFLRDGEFEIDTKNEAEMNELKREVTYYGITTLLKRYSPAPTPVPVTSFDPSRKGKEVICTGTKAISTSAMHWQSAYTAEFSTGLRSLTVQWRGFCGFMVGVAGTGIAPAANGAHTQLQAMLYYANHGSLCAAGSFNSFAPVTSHTAVTVELDCSTRTVTEGQRYERPLIAEVQPPYSFCVDLEETECTATIVSL